MTVSADPRNQAPPCFLGAPTTSSSKADGARAVSPVAPDALDAVFKTLDEYCRTRDWAGYDPYDALNSELFASTPLMNSRIARLAFTQLLKRSPINIRPVLRIAPRRDPKGTAVFLMSYANRARLGDERSHETASTLADRLLSLRSPEETHWCWGYSFPWQTRKGLVPRFSPNLVGTTFGAHALLDAYELGLGEKYLEVGASAGDYLIRKLYWNDRDSAAFAYPQPSVRVPIHNANFLAAALLCRLARLTGDHSNVDPALSAARYSTKAQRPNGSWSYGLAPSQQWIDNFHTGYNLCALKSIRHSTGTTEFDGAIANGTAFYLDHFFTAGGVPKYFHNRTYPVDIHSVAQALITLTMFREDEQNNTQLIARLLRWTMEHMWDSGGFFCYRYYPHMTIRTPYMRWSQAWMLFALSLMAVSRCQTTCSPHTADSQLTHCI